MVNNWRMKTFWNNYLAGKEREWEGSGTYRNDQLKALNWWQKSVLPRRPTDPAPVPRKPTHNTFPGLRITEDNCWLINWPPHREGRENPKKEAGLPRLVGGRFNMQGDLHTRLRSGSHKTNRFPRPPARIFSLYGGLNKVQPRPDGLNNRLLSQVWRPWKRLQL